VSDETTYGVIEVVDSVRRRTPRNDTLPICYRADGIVGGTKLNAAWDPLGVVDGGKQDSREADQHDTTVVTILGVTDGADGG
jgi:hypothetical protein